MNLVKCSEYFNPENVERCHIIGCGSVGSTVAENLARCGITKFTLYDFDKVESKNIANQMFFEEDIGKMKVDALKELILRINPEAEPDIKLKPKGWDSDTISAGYVFLAVDSIEVRKKIVESIMDNPYIKAVFDFRTGLEDAQHFAADWSDETQRKNLLSSMQFTHEEAKEETPVSACGVTLGVCQTVREIAAIGTANFMNFVRGKGIKNIVMADVFGFNVMAYGTEEKNDTV